jgi:hypothetical protein
MHCYALLFGVFLFRQLQPALFLCERSPKSRVVFHRFEKTSLNTEARSTMSKQQKAVLSLYRCFLKAARDKEAMFSRDARLSIEKRVRAEFRANQVGLIYSCFCRMPVSDSFTCFFYDPGTELMSVICQEPVVLRAPSLSALFTLHAQYQDIKRKEVTRIDRLMHKAGKQLTTVRTPGFRGFTTA